MLAAFTQALSGINDWTYLWVVIGLLDLVGLGPSLGGRPGSDRAEPTA